MKTVFPGTVEIRLPRISWGKEKIEEIYNLLQSTPELGFVRKDTIRDHIRQNEERGTIWAAYYKGQILGVANIGSRRAYSHLTRHGEIGVSPQYRRGRIGTCLYFVQILQSLLEGRRLVEDTIIPEYSPWMSGPTKCGEGLGFLPSLSYTHYGTLPQRTSGFKDVQLWGGETLKLRDYYLGQILEKSTYFLVDTPKTRATFEKNMNYYHTHEPELVPLFQEVRDWVFSFAIVQNVKEEVIDVKETVS